MNSYLHTSNPTITAAKAVITITTTPNRVGEMLDDFCPVPSSNHWFTGVKQENMGKF